MQRGRAGCGATELRWDRGGCNCNLVKGGGGNPLSSFSLSHHLSLRLYQSLRVSLSLSLTLSCPPTSPKPLRYSRRQGLRRREFALSSLHVAQSAICRARVYRRGAISCYECQGSTCDIILLLMAHHVTGPLISLEMTAQTAAWCVCVCVCVRACHIIRPP